MTYKILSGIILEVVGSAAQKLHPAYKHEIGEVQS